MRLFVVIDLGHDVRNYLYDLEKSIGNNLAKVKWVAKKNLHLTLKFLGEISDERVEDVKERLRRINASRFKLKLNGIGVFPNENIIRVVWIGLKPEDKIRELQRKVDEETLDISKEAMEFVGHLTIGRIKAVKNKEAFLKRIKELDIKEIEFKVDDFKLFKSTLSKDGPKYELLDNYDLVT